VPNAASESLVLLREGAMLFRFTAREMNGGNANTCTWFAVSYQ
jgi:hypothetical protein